MPNIAISKGLLIKKLYEAILGEELATFIGAGLSMPAGFLSWRDMLREPAEEIKLDVERESHDLVSLAQYYCNANNRTAIDNLVTHNFRTLTEPTQNHKLLSQLPISTFWTTNYDDLLEKALEEQGKLANIKLKDSQLRGTNKPFDATIYKMHGDAKEPSTAVLTRSDYENYGYDERKLFREVLEGDLLTKTFLFLGFSFTDPNFNYVLARLRVLLDGHNGRQHYCIMRKEKSDNGEISYQQIKQELQIQDLKRYGISTCLVDDYSEIEDLLGSLVDRYRRKTVFISGSAFNYGEYSDKDGKKLISEISYRLAEKGYHIVNGYGLGVGTYVINGVAKFCYSTKSEKEISDILTLMPFPLEINEEESKSDFYFKYRELMLEKCGIAIYLFGNKANGEVADGVIEEYEIASRLGVISLPIYGTGGASSVIYNIEKEGSMKKIISIANQDNSSVENTVKSIVNAVEKLSKEDC